LKRVCPLFSSRNLQSYSGDFLQFSTDADIRLSFGCQNNVGPKKIQAIDQHLENGQLEKQ